jgi:hypothetical protein
MVCGNLKIPFFACNLAFAPHEYQSEARQSGKNRNSIGTGSVFGGDFVP